MTHPGSRYRGVDEKVATFDRWTKESPGWLEAAWSHGPVPLYQLTMIRRGKWDELLLRQEQSLVVTPLRSLGALLALRPELREGFPAGKCDVATLREILNGALQACPYSPVSTLEIAGLADRWSTLYPVLTDSQEMLATPMLEAIKWWQSGNQEAALRELEKWVFEKGEDQGKTSLTRERENLALHVMFDLLGSDPAIDHEAVLTEERWTQRMLQSFFRRLSEAGTNPVGRMRASLAAIKVLRIKHGEEKTRLSFGSSEVEGLVLENWLRGTEEGTKLTGDFVLSAFVTGTDFEFRDDGRYAALLHLLGRMEEALEVLESAKTVLTGPRYATKKGWLLRNLGRSEEALALMGRETDPRLWTTLALELNDWKAARNGVFSLVPERSREVRQAMVAVLSGDEKLMGYSSPDRHTDSKLAMGVAERRDDLMAMARHTQLAIQQEKEIGDALAAGKGIRQTDLFTYLGYLDLLPDRERTVALLREVADSPIDDPAWKESAKLTSRLIAAGRLVRLGRGDLAFAGLKSALAASRFPDDALQWKRAAWATDSDLMAYAIAPLMRISELEWPKSSHAQRLTALGKSLTAKTSKKRSASLLRLLEKHRDKLSKEEKLAVIFLPLVDLGWSGAIPKPVIQRVKALLANHDLNKAESSLLDHHFKGYLWQQHTRFPPPSGDGKETLTHRMKWAGLWNPRKKNFQIVDGIARVAQLAKENPEEAGKLLKEVVVRVLLDERLMRETEWIQRRVSSRGSSTSNFDTSGPLTVLVAMQAYGVPSTLAPEVIDALTTPRTGYADSDRDRRAGVLLASAGSHEEASKDFGRYLIKNASPGTGNPGGSDLEVLCLYYRSRAFEAVENDDWGEDALRSFGRLLTLAPFQLKEAIPLIQLIRRKGNAARLGKARALVERFWRLRVLEMPRCKTYQYWQREWSKALSES